MEAREWARPETGIDRLGRLHRAVVEAPSEIRALLERAVGDVTLLCGGVPDDRELSTARIRWVGELTFGLHADRLRFDHQPQVSFQFAMGAVRRFFSARPVAGDVDGNLEIELPGAIYEAERRDMRRSRMPASAAGPRRVELAGAGQPITATVRDWSPQGLGISVPETLMSSLATPLRVRFLDGPRCGEQAYAELRHREVDRERRGWVKLGLSTSGVPLGQEIAVERRATVLGDTVRWQKRPITQDRRATTEPLSEGRAAAVAPASVELVEYPNALGQPIRAIVNTTGAFRGGPAVVIPPAWGCTKETLLGLAATLVATFEQAGEPLAVIRFDGTHRAGESYVDPAHRAPGDEYLGFTFSQAADDIEATFDFLARSSEFASSSIALVTSSLGSIEGRRAMARSGARPVAGWVSVVGMSDLQAGLRTVSGGIDYADGLLRGVNFGIHELAGVRADMDLTGGNALTERLVFLEDARREMARIEVPVTWIHGRHDAWMDLARVRRLMSAGRLEGRRLLEVPCGHQMRNGREAMETFQLVAREVSRMTIGRELTPLAPDLRSFARHERRERERLAEEDVDLRPFWRRYLVGRDENVGIELMTATRAYSELMALQIRRLELREGDHVVDLGAGAGDFAVQLGGRADRPSGVRVTAVDYVAEALARGRARFAALAPADLSLQSVLADLDLPPGAAVPLAAGSADAVMASLVVSYLDADRLLAEARRLLGANGRLVVSTMRRDADISKIYIEGLAELAPDLLRARFGDLSPEEIEEHQRSFLNNASRLLRLEERGHFRFWDADELVERVEATGFVDVQVEPAFGEPPQALVVRARAT